MVNKTISIINPTGIHARPAGLLTKKATQFSSKIQWHGNGEVLDAKRILNIRAGGIKFGDEVSVVCEGEDQQEALSTISDFLATLEE